MTKTNTKTEKSTNKKKNTKTKTKTVSQTLETENWGCLSLSILNVALRLGGCAASRRGMENLLKIKKGIATVLVPGGARESLNGDKDQIKLVLKKRKGFIKLAIKHGVPLVPTFSFGEQRVYDLV